MIAKHLANKQQKINEVLNERWGLQGGGINTSDFIDEIILMMDNDQKTYKRMLNLRMKPEVIAWDTLLNTIKFYLEWYEFPNISTTKDNVRAWFRSNGAEGAVEIVIKELSDHVWEVREEQRKWEREQEAKNGVYLDGKGQGDLDGKFDDQP